MVNIMRGGVDMDFTKRVGEVFREERWKSTQRPLPKSNGSRNEVLFLDEETISIKHRQSPNFSGYSQNKPRCK